MIYVQCDGYISGVNANIFAVRGQHMKVATQSHITFCRRNVLPLHDLLPLALGNAVLTIKIYPRQQRRLCLHTGCIPVPQQQRN